MAQKFDRIRQGHSAPMASSIARCVQLFHFFLRHISILHLLSLFPVEWGALSLGSLDVSLRAVTISPSNLSPTAG